MPNLNGNNNVVENEEEKLVMPHYFEEITEENYKHALIVMKDFIGSKANNQVEDKEANAFMHDANMVLEAVLLDDFVKANTILNNIFKNSIKKGNLSNIKYDEAGHTFQEQFNKLCRFMTNKVKIENKGGKESVINPEQPKRNLKGYDTVKDCYERSRECNEDARELFNLFCGKKSVVKVLKNNRTETHIVDYGRNIFMKEGKEDTKEKDRLEVIVDSFLLSPGQYYHELSEETDYVKAAHAVARASGVVSMSYGDLDMIEEFVDEHSNEITDEEKEKLSAIRQNIENLSYVTLTMKKNVLEKFKNNDKFIDAFMNCSGKTKLDKLNNMYDALEAAKSPNWNSAQYNDMMFSVKEFLKKCSANAANSKNKKIFEYPAMEKDMKKIFDRMDNYIKHVGKNSNPDKYRTAKLEAIEKLKDFFEKEDGFDLAKDKIDAKAKMKAEEAAKNSWIKTVEPGIGY